jgi:hypothetical protein
VTAFQTTLGITVSQFTTEVQSYVDQQVNQLNTDLQQGIQIPTIYGIDVSDVELINHDGYIEGGVSVKAGFWEGIGQIHNFFSEEFEKINASMEPVELHFLQA